MLHLGVSNTFKYIFFKDFFCLLEREEGREQERERNVSVWLPLTHPHLGTWLAM